MRAIGRPAIGGAISPPATSPRPPSTPANRRRRCFLDHTSPQRLSWRRRPRRTGEGRRVEQRRPPVPLPSLEPEA
ncbi:unnamed protein product, partial [Cyprideis torosa]